MTPTPSTTVSSLRPADTRGTTQIGWLDSKHSFAFGSYYHPDRLGYHGLRVLNDDRVAPGGGFGTHPHDNMEILSWVVDGGLSHRDSMGSVSTLRPGTAQLMLAGTGVTHSEFNGSDAEPVHFLQIWIEPKQTGLAPNYQELQVADRTNRFAPVATPDGRDGSMTIRADASVYVADVDAGGDVSAELGPGRVGYAHVVTGTGTLNGQAVQAGDAVTVEPAGKLDASSDAGMQVLWFDLPA